MSDLLDSPYQREAQVRIAGVLIRNAVALQDIGALSPGYGTKAEAVAREILLNCYPDEDTHDPNTAALIRQVKREGERARQLEATNELLDALAAQLLVGESWGDRIQRDPLFAAQVALADCSEEVVNRTELAQQFEQRIAELERREALLTAFVVAEDRFNAMMDSGDWDGDDDAYLTMMAARQALTDAGFPTWEPPT